MQRNTFTTLGQLRVGDIFNFKGRADRWRVTKQTGASTMVNQFLPWGQPVHKFDHVKRNTAECKFIIHTQPQPGEETNITYLQPGDVFFTRNDIITDYTLVQHGVTTVKCINKKMETTEIGNLEMVTLVRKAEEAVV